MCIVYILDRERDVVGFEEGEDANVGGRIAEPRDGRLQQGGAEPAVEPAHSPLVPQRPVINCLKQ